MVQVNRFSLVAIALLVEMLAADACSQPACAQTPVPETLPAGVEAWRPIARFDDAGIRESSGVVKSRRFPGVFWTHNDSGNSATLYAFRATGAVIARIPVEGAINSDWEDMAADSDGFLYIGDIGNNFGLLAQRAIYKVREPDPFADPPSAARVEEVFFYSFDGPRFDAEALIALNGKLFVISKERGRARLYRLERRDEKHPHRLAPTAVAELRLSAVTGADVSPDERRLAVCTCDRLEVYRLVDSVPEFTGERLLGAVDFPCGSIEACGFDGDDVLLSAESGEIYRVREADLTVRTRFVVGHPPKE